MKKVLPNYYQILCLPQSATADELRRAYRVLARRYHPDVNPGKASEEKFKAIAEAYQVLSDVEQRRAYDIELSGQQRQSAQTLHNQHARRTAQARYREHEQKLQQSRQRQEPPRPPTQPSTSPDFVQRVKKSVSNFILPLAKAVRSKAQSAGKLGTRKVSILEVSVSLRDALQGIRKSVEILEPEGSRKISISIPPGARTGSVIRLRDTRGSGEELVIIVRVADHPFMSIESKGLVVEVPITVAEALHGANITLPTIDDPIVVKVPAGSQSGNDLRIKGKGIVNRDGTRGDLFYRLMLRLPENARTLSSETKLTALDPMYSPAVRSYLPKTLLDAA